MHQFLLDISPYGADGKLLPEISMRKLPEPGTADKAVQSYNFRLCLTDVAENRVLIAPSAGLRCTPLHAIRPVDEARTKAEGHVPALPTVIKLDRIQNGKTDINNQGPFSTDFIGGSWQYPDASYAQRAQIWQEHRNYVQGSSISWATMGRCRKACGRR